MGRSNELKNRNHLKTLEQQLPVQKQRVSQEDKKSNMPHFD
jgi:hypothetical protein